MKQHVLITGAGGGIGKACALAAAAKGWDVVASVRNMVDEEELQRSAQQIGVALRVVELDVTNAEQCEAVINEVKPTVLINNAGFGSVGAIEDVNDAEARKTLEVMTVAPMRLARLSIPHMRERGVGRIINVSSLGGRTASPLTGWYTASKHALEALSVALRNEVARDNIKVVVIEPGGVSTGILEKTVDSMSVSNSAFDKSYKRAEKLTRLTQRFQGHPDRVAKVIVEAVESPRPRARYLVGIDAYLLLAGGLFPTPIRDRFKRKVLGL